MPEKRHLPSLPLLRVPFRYLLMLPVLLLAVTLCSDLSAETYAVSAPELMKQLENDFRAGPRLVKIEFHTTFTAKGDRHLSRTMWGVINGDTADTRMLYVVTQPERMRGTTLLFADKADTAAPDSTWLYLSAIKKVRQLDIRSARAWVPGTALTYEDSRGFIPIDKYSFQYYDSSEIAPDEVLVLAKPLTDSISLGVGFTAMYIRIDTSERVIRQIDYANTEGERFKKYLLEETTQIDGVNFPARIMVSNNLNNTVSIAGYTYVNLPAPPVEPVFDWRHEESLYITRLNRLLVESGLNAIPERK